MTPPLEAGVLLYEDTPAGGGGVVSYQPNTHRCVTPKASRIK